MTKPGEATRAAILRAGVDLAGQGMHCVTIRAVARAAGIKHSNVSYYFGSVAGLCDAVATEAVATGSAPAIARLIMDRHPVVSGMPVRERNRWMTDAGLLR